jgi:hypothetical protein
MSVTDWLTRVNDRRLVVGFALVAVLMGSCLAVASPSKAEGRLLVGVDDDSLKWYRSTSQLLALYSELGVGTVRVTFDWRPGEATVAGDRLSELRRVSLATRRLRVVLAVGGPADAPPVDEAAQAEYCAFVASVLHAAPGIRDVVIWTEPNSASFWRPQTGAPAAYEALLARCWDVLHAAAGAMNVIAASAPHQAPARWFRALGAAYRASGRRLPIFDTVGHNVYPENSAESPAATHRGSIDQGDLSRLLSELSNAFAGTGQPLPGSRGVSVWYMENGFESRPTTHDLYTGTKLNRSPVSEEEQAAQLVAAVRLAYCQPTVGAFFNFQLRDEPALAGWQSGLLRPSWTPKPAFGAYQQVIAEARAGTISCQEQSRRPKWAGQGSNLRPWD